MKKFTYFLLILLSVFFIVGGLNHFLNPKFYLRMMPGYLPFPGQLVAISGVFEMALGLLILSKKYRVLAGWGLIALLIAVFPANIQMAFHPETFPEFNPVSIYLRLPLQFLLIAWVYFTTIKWGRNSLEDRN